MKERPEFVKYGSLITLVEPEDAEPYLERDLHVFEKVDGGNCQVRNVDGWNLAAGVKANYLDGKKAKSRPWFGKLLKWMYSNESLYNLPSNLILFGEWSGNHTINYPEDNSDKFFVIDVKDMKSGKFMKYNEGRDFVEQSGVRGVRFLEVLAEGKLDVEVIKELLNEQSDLYEGHREGLVIKAYDNPQAIFRMHHPAFAEAFRSLSGRVEYVTPMRIQRNLHKLLDEGSEHITRDVLIGRVVRDVTEDGGKTSRSYVGRQLNTYIETGKLGDMNIFLDRMN
jgi:hypothetical protein